MAFSFLWDATYEAAPAAGLNRALIDDKLRDLARAVRARMEVGHNFGPYTDEDDGTHRGGHVEVMVKDDSAARDLLTDVRVGGLYLLEDGSDLKLCICTSVGPVVWEEISSLDHGELDDLDAHDHTQYLKTTGGLVTGLDLGGNKIIMPTNEEAQRGLVQYHHIGQSHPTIGNADAITTNNIVRDKLYILSASAVGNIGNGINRTFNFAGSLVFLPNFCFVDYANGTAVLKIGGDQAVCIFGDYFGVTKQYRVNYRYIP